ncbi:RIP metalloprotease RseP [candidate division KSB1 bacterium]|nr:RIP metalloprotease RseP [candidate division KSB1 bacterium]
MLVTLLAFIFVLGVLVFIHEFGHFILAKMVGIRVERFSLGFPPRMIGKKIGDTDYCLSWVPIGGYVKMSGMIDESMEADSIKGEPWEFMSKPYYQRFLVIFAGPLMNILLAVLIFAAMTYITGISEALGPMVGDVRQDSYVASLGFQKGDLLTQINNQPVETWNEVMKQVHGKQNVSVQWMRGDSLMNGNFAATFADSLPQSVPPVVGSVIPDFPADSIGMKEGDRIVSINDTAIVTWNDLTAIIHKRPDRAVTVVWERDGKQLSSDAVPRKDATDGLGKIGIAYALKQKEVGPGKALASGFTFSYNLTYMVYKSLKRIFTGQESVKNAFGGPIQIAKMAGDSARAGAGNLFVFMAFLSLNLGFLNLLPVPVLDGGHLLILTIEAVIRRPISTKAKMIVQQIGMALLLILMVFVIINDIRNIL